MIVTDERLGRIEVATLPCPSMPGSLWPRTPLRET